MAGRGNKAKRRRTPGYWIVAGLALFLAGTAGAFAWMIYASGPPEGLAALADGRIVTIELASGHAEGGLRPQKMEMPEEPVPTPPAETPTETHEGEAAASSSSGSSGGAETPLPPGADALPAAPDSAVSEQDAMGTLPMTGKGGEKAWQVYARPAKTATGPKIAVLVTGLGLSRSVAEAAAALPPDVSLSFSPYASDVATWVSAARARGHEVLVDLPAEPVGFPAADPGPQALLTTQSETENEQRLRWVLAHAVGGVGVYLAGTEQFTLAEQAMKPVMSSLAQRGLMMVTGIREPRETLNKTVEALSLPHAEADIRLDELSPDSIGGQLLAVENLARNRGDALLICGPYPLTVKAVAEWVQELEKKGFTLVPVSALARKKVS